MEDLTLSEEEKNNLSLHVELSRAKLEQINKDTQALDNRVVKIEQQIDDFKDELRDIVSDIKDVHREAIAEINQQNNDLQKAMIKVIITATATVIGGLLSTIVVILVAFL